jgi:hypothetical protein
MFHDLVNCLIKIKENAEELIAAFYGASLTMFINTNPSLTIEQAVQNDLVHEIVKTVFVCINAALAYLIVHFIKKKMEARNQAKPKDSE